MHSDFQQEIRKMCAFARQSGEVFLPPAADTAQNGSPELCREIVMEKPVFRPSGQMVLLMGIPATGKSTFVGTFLCSTHAHVSLDLLGTRRREFDALQAALADGGSAAVDDTNVT